MHVTEGVVLLDSHIALDMTDLHFVVHPGAALVFKAPGLTLKRSQVSKCHLR